jgi:hypothetical protein
VQYLIRDAGYPHLALAFADDLRSLEDLVDFGFEVVGGPGKIPVQLERDAAEFLRITWQ